MNMPMIVRVYNCILGDIDDEGGVSVKHACIDDGGGEGVKISCIDEGGVNVTVCMYRTGMNWCVLIDSREE